MKIPHIMVLFGAKNNNNPGHRPGLFISDKPYLNFTLRSIRRMVKMGSTKA